MSAEPIVFTTGRVTRIGAIFIAILFGVASLLFVPLGTVLAAGAVVVFGGPEWLAIIAAVVMLMILTPVVWRVVAEQVRFCVVIRPRHVQIGRGLVRRVLRCEDVDEVVLLNDNTDGRGIGVRARRRDCNVRLPLDQARECFRALVAACPNAVFQDEDGREYVHANQTRPEKTLLAIERHQYRVGFRCLMACPPLALWAAFNTVKVIQWGRGVVVVPAVAVPKLWLMTVLSAAAPLLCIWLASSAYSKAHFARAERLEILNSQTASVGSRSA